MGRKTSDRYVNDKTEVKEVTFKDWICEHKVAVGITLGLMFAPVVFVGAVAVVGAIGAVNSQDDSDSDNSSGFEFHDSNIVNFADIKSDRKSKAPYSVNGFVRNLPEGWNASPAKVAEAAEMGIKLEKNQTYVDSYRTGTRD